MSCTTTAESRRRRSSGTSSGSCPSWSGSAVSVPSYSHGTAFVKGVEEIMGLEIPPRAQYIRTIIAEVERMHSHLLWLGVAALMKIRFNTLFMRTWGDREGGPGHPGAAHH